STRPGPGSRGRPSAAWIRWRARSTPTETSPSASAASSSTCRSARKPSVKIRDWLEERTGYRRIVAAALEEPVAGGASWAYVFGSVLAIILVNQIVTGILLAMYYSPSAQTAWASVAYVQDQVSAGWFIRGLHANGASAMVIVAGFHMLQVAVYGAYRKPREINWLVGAIMLLVLLAFALTGYLLPWDQKGYWATKVATGIMGETPFIGEWLQQVVQGGNEYGNLTLSRFFAIHVFILPGALLTFLAIHLALFRKHGITPRWGRTAGRAAGRRVRFRAGRPRPPPRGGGVCAPPPRGPPPGAPGRGAGRPRRSRLGLRRAPRVVLPAAVPDAQVLPRG